MPSNCSFILVWLFGTEFALPKCRSCHLGQSTSRRPTSQPSSKFSGFNFIPLVCIVRNTNNLPTSLKLANFSTTAEGNNIFARIQSLFYEPRYFRGVTKLASHIKRCVPIKMSLQELMEQWQVMSDRRREEDRARDKARLLEDMTFEGRKRAKLQALVVDVTARVPSYESRSAGALKSLEIEQEHEFTDLQRKHKAQLKALQKKQEEEIAALPEKYTRKAADIEKNLRADMQWELDLMLEVEQSALENAMSVERRRALETRDREDRIRVQARALVDQDLNSQVLTIFREEASRQNQPHRDVTLQLPSQQPLKSILKKPRGLSVNSDGFATVILNSDDETLDDRKIKRVKVEERSSRSSRARAADVLDEQATLFPYRENSGTPSRTPRSPRTPWTPRTPRTPRTPQGP